jgi:peptide/nickel transport system substrate-binding protein
MGRGPIVNSAVRLANLQAGALDLVGFIVPTDVATVQKDPKLRVAMVTSLAYNGITFNTGNGPAGKTPIGMHARLRRAFELALDRKAIIHVVYNDLYVPVAQANAPSSRFYVSSIVPPKRDIAAAKALIEASGVKTPIPVTLLVPNSPDLLQAAQMMQAMVEPAGFALKIRAMEFASALGVSRSGDFEAFFIGWSGRADADGNMYPFFHSGGGFDIGNYHNPKIDALLDRSRLAANEAERRAIYAQIWKIEREDMPLIYLWSPIGGLQLGTLLSGAVLTEQVFNVPGIGKLVVDAVFNPDYPVIQGVVLVTGLLYILINLATDLLYAVINPRLRGR